MRSLKTKDGRVIKPYVYQKTSFKLLVTALQKYRRALMVMATGLGKTITSILVLLHFLKPKNRVLFLCHDTGILDQAFRDFKEFLSDAYSCTKFYGQKKDWNADTHNIVFATFQSMASHLADGVKRNIFSNTHFDYIIVDEGHHAKAETYESVLEYFIAKWKMAMTATPDREDEEDITEIFGKPVVNIELPEAIAKGWLTPVDYRVLSDGLNEELIKKLVAEVLDDNVRITEKQINERIFVKIRTQEQVKEILKESKDKQAIIFCQNITHLRHVAEFLPQSVWVHSKQTDDENKETMRAFKKKRARHILVVDKFNEGIDIPSVELIVFLRGTDSRRIFLQQLGRGLRKLLGKKKVTILDFVGNIRRIQEIKTLVERIRSLVPKGGKRKVFTPLHVEGAGFTFDFTENVVDLLKVFNRNQVEFAPPGWITAQGLVSKGVSRNFIRKIAEKFRQPHPEWLKVYQTATVIAEHYHPELVSEIKKAIKNRGELAPENWMTPHALSKDVHIYYKNLKVKVEKYRAKHAGWFKTFYDGTGKTTEYYHPELVAIVKKELRPEQKLNGWESASSLRDSGVKSGTNSIKTFAETFRKKHTGWFKLLLQHNVEVECYHPHLVDKIKQRFSEMKIPGGWLKVTEVLKSRKKVGRIREFTKQFRNNHPEWFKDFLIYGHFIEHYHPKLIEKIRIHFQSK